jgi:hypothetical protein
VKACRYVKFPCGRVGFCVSRFSKLRPTSTQSDVSKCRPFASLQAPQLLYTNMKKLSKIILHLLMNILFQFLYWTKFVHTILRGKQLLDDLKEKRRYWNLKEEALDRNLWRTRFGRGYGPVVRQTTEWMNTFIFYCDPLIKVTIQTGWSVGHDPWFIALSPKTSANAFIQILVVWDAALSCVKCDHTFSPLRSITKNGFTVDLTYCLILSVP